MVAAVYDRRTLLQAAAAGSGMRPTAIDRRYKPGVGFP
jgi:hypothetical protein